MDLAEVRERMVDGRLYASNCPELFAEQARYRDVLDAYNRLPFGSADERERLLRELVAEAGADCMIEPPFHANWGGANLHLGDRCMRTWGSRLWTMQTFSSRTM